MSDQEEKFLWLWLGDQDCPSESCKETKGEFEIKGVYYTGPLTYEVKCLQCGCTHSLKGFGLPRAELTDDGSLVVTRSAPSWITQGPSG